jgi:hypothetical protein
MKASASLMMTQSLLNVMIRSLKVPPTTTVPVVDSADPYPGWASYVNTDYGLTFRYPPTWALEEQPGEEMADGLSAKSVALTQGTLRLLIQYKRPEEALILGPGGRPASDVEDRGTMTVLGHELPKHVLVFDGEEMSVFLGDRFEQLELYIQLDDVPGREADYKTIDIPDDLQAEVDQILESFELVVTR